VVVRQSNAAAGLLAAVLVIVVSKKIFRFACIRETTCRPPIKYMLESGAPQQYGTMVIFGNEVRVRIVNPVSTRGNKFIGLVHNPGTDAKPLLDLAV
jgi:hypothetical protein